MVLVEHVAEPGGSEPGSRSHQFTFGETSDKGRVPWTFRLLPRHDAYAWCCGFPSRSASAVLIHIHACLYVYMYR